MSLIEPALILMFWWLKQKFETRDILHLIFKKTLAMYFNFDSIKRTAAYKKQIKKEEMSSYFQALKTATYPYSFHSKALENVWM